MPYTLEHRGDEWCVIKDSDGKSMGCHASRARAVQQQKALYAQEDGMTAAVNAIPNDHQRIEIVQPPPAQRVEIQTFDSEVASALVASVEVIAERLQATETVLGQVVGALAKVVEEQNEDRESLRAALTAAMERPDPTVNVTVPEMQPPTVNIHVPKTKLLIPTPIVNVTMPGSKKTVKFNRNLQGEVEGADIMEELDG